MTTKRGDGYRTDCRVVHVEPDTHAAAYAFCRFHGLTMTEWVSSLILEFEARRDGPAPPRVGWSPPAMERWLADVWRKPRREVVMPTEPSEFGRLLAEHGQGVRECPRTNANGSAHVRCRTETEQAPTGERG